MIRVSYFPGQNLSNRPLTSWGFLVDPRPMFWERIPVPYETLHPINRLWLTKSFKSKEEHRQNPPSACYPRSPAQLFSYQALSDMFESEKEHQQSPMLPACVPRSWHGHSLSKRRRWCWSIRDWNVDVQPMLPLLLHSELDILLIWHSYCISLCPRIWIYKRHKTKNVDVVCVFVALYGFGKISR